MANYLVGQASEIPPGSKKIVMAGSKSIGVYNVGGQFYAILNYCPHQGAQLCSGITTSLVKSDRPGEFSYECEGEIVRCPWHFWEFDLKSGRMIVDPKTRTMTYDVTVEKFDVTVDDGQVIIHV